MDDSVTLFFLNKRVITDWRKKKLKKKKKILIQIRFNIKAFGHITNVLKIPKYVYLQYLYIGNEAITKNYASKPSLLKERKGVWQKIAIEINAEAAFVPRKLLELLIMQFNFRTTANKLAKKKNIDHITVSKKNIFELKT